MKTMDLNEKWISLAAKYTNNELLIKDTCNRIILNYNHESRHYHTLSHLEKMFSALETINTKLVNADAVCFALWFHDIVYNAKANDNEEKSAEMAEIQLKKLNVPADLIELVTALILHTKNHTVVYNDESTDMQYFLDADLAVLGSVPDEYEVYKNGVRNEYNHVPDMLYRMGRKKVLKKFLSQKSIYRRSEFQKAFEQNARKNIQSEIDQL